MTSQITKKDFEFQVGYVQCEKCGLVLKQGEEETHEEVCLGNKLYLIRKDLRMSKK